MNKGQMYPSFWKLLLYGFTGTMLLNPDVVLQVSSRTTNGMMKNCTDAYLEALEKFDRSEKSMLTLMSVMNDMFHTFDLRRLEEHMALLFTLPNLRRETFTDAQLKVRFDYRGQGAIDVFIHRADGTVFAMNLHSVRSASWALRRAVLGLDFIQQQRGQKGRRDRVRYEVRHQVAVAIKYSKTDMYYKPSDNLTLTASFLCDKFDLGNLFANAVNFTLWDRSSIT